MVRKITVDITSYYYTFVSYIHSFASILKHIVWNNKLLSIIVIADPVF